eukprot:5400103-Pyramimonas_sp.AAC.2
MTIRMTIRMIRTDCACSTSRPVRGRPNRQKGRPALNQATPEPEPEWGQSASPPVHLCKW